MCLEYVLDVSKAVDFRQVERIRFWVKFVSSSNLEEFILWVEIADMCPFLFLGFVCSSASRQELKELKMRYHFKFTQSWQSLCCFCNGIYLPCIDAQNKKACWGLMHLAWGLVVESLRKVWNEDSSLIFQSSCLQSLLKVLRQSDWKWKVVNVCSRYNIDTHDYDVRLRAAKRFLQDGDKVSWWWVDLSMKTALLFF